MICATGLQEVYPYTEELLALEACSAPAASPLPSRWRMITTPLNLEAWSQCLVDHPDKSFVIYILHGIACGFRVGFEPQSKLRPRKRNMKSASQNPGVVEAYLREEIGQNRVVPVMPEEERPVVHTSPFGVIPKKRNSAKWRLIVDLSAPENASVNDGIDRSLCSLAYVSVDTVAEAVLELGRGTEMAKMDIKQAYRMVPVYPDDRPLLGMSWQGTTFLDTALPFGLRSAPKVFNALADALQWVVQDRGVFPLFHYLDDYITLGPPGTGKCGANLQLLLDTCGELGVPIAQEKCEGPTPCLEFLGIVIDTLAMEVRLSDQKMRDLRAELTLWGSRSSCKKRQLQSLIGVLNHACRVVRPGRSFLRRLIDLSCVRKHAEDWIRLGEQARSDIAWWKAFATSWNGRSICLSARASDLTITSDASGHWGCGAFFEHRWFQLQWPDQDTHDAHITVKELIPVVVGAAVWGRHWVGRTVTARSDNMATVTIINSGTCRDPRAMHLLRSLFFIAAHFDFCLRATHIRGIDNGLADALSRDNLTFFLHTVPQANPKPSPIPPAVIEVLLTKKPDWTSTNWQRLFASISEAH